MALPAITLTLLLPSGAMADEKLADGAIRLQPEVGIQTDVSNELYFVESFDDTLFLTRQSASDPMTRTALLLALRWDKPGLRGAWATWVRPEVRWGDYQQSVAIQSNWTRESLSDTRWVIAPWANWARDRSFGLDRRETRAGVDLRARWQSLSGSRWEGRGAFDWLDASGSDIATLQHRGVVRAELRWSPQVLPPLSSLDLSWASDLRWFPDSTPRNHLQQRFGGSISAEPGRNAMLQVRGDIGRRGTLTSRTSTRDRFWDPQLEASLRLRSNSAYAVEVLAGSDWLRYDHADSIQYFDYELSHLRILGERALGDGFRAAMGPRLEWMTSRDGATERYAQVGGTVELQATGASMWWSLVAEAGWRQYELESSNVATSSGVHSSYAFTSLAGMFEQQLQGRARLRLVADLRVERHRDPSQDARGLYILAELRTLP